MSRVRSTFSEYICMKERILQHGRGCRNFMKCTKSSEMLKKTCLTISKDIMICRGRSGLNGMIFPRPRTLIDEYALSEINVD